MIEELCRDQEGFWIGVTLWVGNELLEYWLGKTNKTRAGSKLELIKNLFFKKKILTKGDVMKVVLGDGVELVFEGGKLILSADVAKLVLPKIEELKAKLNSGEVDVVKGTDFDKIILLMALDFIKGEITKP